MKKLFILCASALALNVAAQSSLSIINKSNNNAPVAANATVEVASIPFDAVETKFDFKNNSGAQVSYKVKRYDMVLHHIGADSAHAHFCIGEQCYGKGTFVSPNAVVLGAGVAASGLPPSAPGSDHMLWATLDETTDPNVVGLSVIKYTFFNTANQNDSIQFTVRYNYLAAGLKVSDKDLSTLDVFPNPSVGAASLKLNSTKAFDSRVRVINSLGEVVFEKAVSVAEGKNKIALETENLPSGVYFVILKAGDKAVTRKLIINN